MGVTGGEPLGFNLGAQGPGGTLPGLDLVSSSLDLMRSQDAELMSPAEEKSMTDNCQLEFRCYTPHDKKQPLYVACWLSMGLLPFVIDHCTSSTALCNKQ